MGELEFKQQSIKKLEATKEALIKQLNDLDTTIKNVAGALQLLDAQIVETKKEIDALDVATKPS